MKHWLVKQEPEAYAWKTFVKDGKTTWTGVRNFQARISLRAMRLGDRVLFYHSVTQKAVVGVARVTREAFPDPTATEGDWSAVEIAPLKELASPVGLDQIKADPKLSELPLIRQSRLSVMPLASVQFSRILELGKTRL